LQNIITTYKSRWVDIEASIFQVEINIGHCLL